MTDKTLLPPVDIAFTSEVDGTEQRYMMLIPSDFDPSKSHHLLIALHGHGSDRWQFATHELDEGRGSRDVAAKYGMLYVSPDYRAYTSWMGPKAEADMVQIIRDLRATYRIGKVIVLGASMGGSSSLSFGALRPDLVDGVVSYNGTANHLEYENFQEAIAESFGGSKREIPEEYKRRSAEYWPERFIMPVACAVGGCDESVPPDSVLRLCNVLQQIGRQVLLIHRPEGGHSTTYEDTCTALEFVLQACGITVS